VTDRTFEQIKERLTVVGAGFGNPGSASYQELIYALEYCYNAPAAAGLNIAQSWNDWLDQNPTQNLVVEFHSGKAQAIVNGGQISIDPAYATSVIYITEDGKAVYHTLRSVLLHELGHAVAGLHDEPTVSINSPGENTTAINSIYSLLGIPEVAHYWGQSDQQLNFLVPTFDYTGGKLIDIAIVGRSVDTSGNGGKIDLLIGGYQDDVLVSGGGDDFLYGGLGNGNDNLAGGAGNDKLYGDGGDDILDGGSDNDLIWGGIGGYGDSAFNRDLGVPIFT
jgi:Ca2+-binding RTX toxin-like protein